MSLRPIILVLALGILPTGALSGCEQEAPAPAKPRMAPPKPRVPAKPRTAARRRPAAPRAVPRDEPAPDSGSPAGSRSAGPPLVVLDPGHGGTNLGARGQSVDVYEKKLALIYANLTAAHLRSRMPSVKVVLTRTRDRYLTLTQRVRMANAMKAAVFVSIHLNACETHVQKGFGTFILSRSASDKEAARMAQKESEALRARARTRKPASASKSAAVDSIMSNLRHVGAHTQSVRLAANIQKTMTRARGKALNRGIKQASFDVLMGLSMPAALVEIGFIDHHLEGPELATATVQKAISRALAEGIIAHLSPPPKRTRLRPTRRRARKRPAAKKTAP